MNIADNWYNMNKKALIPRVIFCTDARGTRNPLFATTCYNKFAFIYFSEVDAGLFFPKSVEIKSPLVTQDIIVIERIVNTVAITIAISRSLAFNNNKIFNIRAERIILLQIENCLLDFFSGIFNLLTNCFSLSWTILRTSNVILHKLIKRKFSFLVVYLNFEDMFEVIFVELKIFGVNVVYSLVYRHDFFILILEFLQFALLDLKAAIRYRKKYKHNGEQCCHNIHIARPKCAFIIAIIHK